MAPRRIGDQGVYLLNPTTGQQDYLQPGQEVTDEQAAKLGPHVFEDFDADDATQLAAAVNGPASSEPAAGGGNPDGSAAGAPEPEVRVVVSPIPGDTDGYEALTVEDLKAIADARGIEVADSAEKPDVIDAILDADDELYAALAALAVDADGLSADLNGGAPASDGTTPPGGAAPPAEPKPKGGGKSSASS